MPVLVVDHESSDGTRAIAEERGATVITRPFTGFLDARHFALERVRTPWTLMIDADEALDDRLRAAVAAADPGEPGYFLRRDTYFCGRPLRMWRGERLLRLFQRDRALLRAYPVAGGNAQLHERWEVPGAARELDGTLLHYSYESRGDYERKFAEYTAAEARGVRRSAARIAAEAGKVPLRFLWYAFARGALLDGTDGAYVALQSAFYTLAVQCKAR